MYIEMKQKDIIILRAQILKDQNGCCALCGEPITEKSGISLDHQHGKKSEINGEDGKGLIRGVLCRGCNVEEGKIWNSMNRYLQPENVQNRIEWLESLIEYYKTPNYNRIHPSEVPKNPKFTKRCYLKLKKEYLLSSKRGKFPNYTGKLTKPLTKLFELFKIKVEYYKC